MSQEVIIMHGLPASGKSTWAKSKTSEDKTFKRLCRDDYREMLDNYSMSNELETIITQMFLSDLKILLKAGYSVILDNTNLKPKYIKEYAKVIREIDSSIPISIKSFEHIHRNELVERDAERFRPVGKEVIDRMLVQLKSNSSKSLEKYLTEIDPTIYQTYVPNYFKQDAIIVDIDGTIAHGYHRGPYEWDKVYGDEVDKTIKNLLQILQKEEGLVFIYLSGRDGVCYKDTRDWLNDSGFPDGLLYMREPGDIRKDAIVKYELFDTHIRDNYNVLFVLDDRNKVVDMWRSIGLKCLQVQEGDF